MSEPRTLFTLTYAVGVKRTDTPLEVLDGDIRLEFTPTGLRHLLSELKPPSIHALMLLIEHGFRPGKPIEKVGFGNAWLIEMGMKKSQAETAIGELLEKGYLQKYRLNGQVTGKQVGVLPSSTYGLDVIYEGTPRLDGRPRKVSRDPGNPETRMTGNGSTSLVSTESGNDVSPVPENQEIKNDDDTFPQVSPVSRTIGNEPEPPTSSSVKEEVLLYANTTTPDFGWLQQYITQDPFVASLRTNRDAAISTLTRAISDHEMRCAPIAVHFGLTTEGVTAARSVATLIINIADGTTNPRDILTTARAHHKNINDPALLQAAVVAGLLTALSTTVKSYGGWFGAMLTNQSFLANAGAKSALTAFDSIVLNDFNHDGTTRPVQQSPDDIALLARAAIGTNWVDDDEMFAMLLRNPSRQNTLRHSWDTRTPEQQEAALTADQNLFNEDEGSITYAAFLAGGYWDTTSRSFVHPPR